MLRIAQREIGEPPKMLSTIQGEYVAGVVTVDDQLTIVLDLAKLLSEEELRKLNESTRRRSTGPDMTATSKKDKIDKTDKTDKTDSNKQSSDDQA